MTDRILEDTRDSVKKLWDLVNVDGVLPALKL